MTDNIYPNYACKCSCGTYTTACDMPLGVARRAAEMHIMLEGKHRVSILARSGIEVEAYERSDKVSVSEAQD